MTKVEKVIKGLEHHKSECEKGDVICPYFDDDMCSYTLSSDALELLKERQWVSVKDRLPENNRFVLVCNDDWHMMVAQYIEETAQWQYKYINYDVDVWDDEEQGPVCWWAELPEPPKEEEK